MQDGSVSRKILLVDARAEWREKLKSCLQSIPHQHYFFYEANTGAAGLELLRTTPLTAIYVAAQLPEMSACEWLVQGQRQAQSSTPIIVLLPDDEISLVQQHLQAGAEFCVTEAQLSPALLQQICSCVSAAQESAAAREARDTAENANRTKDEFIVQITHDLRAPLSAVLGWAKVLQNKNATAEIRAEAIQAIVDSAEKQKHLIDDLLDTARMAVGKLRLDIRPVSLGAVIRSAMDIMQPAFAAKQLNCLTELATDADVVTGDSARLEQVIWNLVFNAVKFTPNNGEIKVRLERADPFVQITISDTGCGINAEYLPFIFDRYWQPSTGGHRRLGGLGLGLSLVKHIVELHGGNVTAQSEGENQGAAFTVNLPYCAVRVHPADENSSVVFDVIPVEIAPADEFAAPPLSSASLAGLSVLIVDDEFNARELVAEILRQHGATAVLADSAATAFAHIAESPQRPDLLISDISMPDEDGYMLIRKIRSLPLAEGGAIPAVALTAFGRMEDRVRVLSAGFQMHLPKPVEPAELAIVVANLTRREIKK